MTYVIGQPRFVVSRARRARRNILSAMVAPSVALGVCIWAGHSQITWRSAAPVVTSDATSRPAPAPAAPAAPPRRDPLLSPAFSLNAPARTLAESAPMQSAFQWANPPATTMASAEPPRQSAEPKGPTVAALDPADDAEEDSPEIPLPLARPPELRAPLDVARPGGAPTQPLGGSRSKLATAATAPADDRGFFEKLFGVQRSAPGQAMAYAAPQDEEAAPRKSIFGSFSSPSVKAGEGTAVYDIKAKVVYMPDGERLEAHSGLGDKRDDPRYVNVSMRGPTPPHVYDLSLREQLFHGVRALRLNPVGGSGAIHGRVGLLAHTFMLGPNGDSNGCISFRDYDKFLQAYLKGQVKRLVVVASAS